MIQHHPPNSLADNQLMQTVTACQCELRHQRQQMVPNLDQSAVGWMQQSRHWQVTASHERCSASGKLSETAPSCWTALTRCGRSGHVQAMYY